MSIHQLLDFAIANKKTIQFNYDNAERIVEPHHYGLLNNDEQLHAYQTGGDSNSGGIPEWRNFKLEKIKTLTVNDSTFVPEVTYNPSNSHYQTIVREIDIVKINTEK